MTYKPKTFAGASRIFVASVGHLGLAYVRALHLTRLLDWLRPPPLPDEVQRKMDRWTDYR